MTTNGLLKAIGCHCRPTTLAALCADLEASQEALDTGVLDNLMDALSGNIGWEAGKALIEAERREV